MILVPALHPSFLIRRGGGADMGGKELARFFQTCIADMKKAKRLSVELPRWDEGCIWRRDAGGRLISIFPTLAEVWAFAQAARGYDLAVDVETTGNSPLDCRLICVGLASANGTYICVPFLRQYGGAYWSPTEGAQAWEIVKLLLGDSLTPKVFHNGSFDKLVVESFGAPVIGWRADTMQAQHVVDSELPLGLGFCATRHLDVAYWKDDAKGAKRWLDLPDEQLRVYNARDCLTTLRLKPILEAEVLRLGLWDLYQQEIDICHLMCRATVRGLLLDEEARDSTTIDPATGKPIGLAPRLVLQRDDALVRLRSVAGSSYFDPNKPKHLQHLLFDMLGLPVVLETKTGQPATNKDAMVQLGILADTPAQKYTLSALADWKVAAKKISTFTGENKNGVHVGGLPIGADGRLHVQWKLTTNTGRLASSPNAQNWDSVVKHLFKSGLSRKYVGVDLNQAELRFIGLRSDDPVLLQAYEKDIDLHTVNMAWYLKMRYPDGHDNANAQTVAFLRATVPQVHRGATYDSLPAVPKARQKTVRTLAKVCEFSTNYRSLADTVYTQVRAKRDPDTNTLMFSDISLSQVEAILQQKIKSRPGLVSWWARNQKEIEQRGYAQCPISGRMRHFRGGFKITECANWGIQAGIASWMNKCMLEIQNVYDRETGGDCLVVQQVHDALNVDSPDEYTTRAGQVMEEILGRKFPLPGHPQARLPPDKAKSATHLDAV